MFQVSSLASAALILIYLETRNKRKPFIKPVLKKFDSGSEEEFVLSGIGSHEDDDEDSGEYVPDAAAEKEIRRQDNESESRLKKKVKFESGAMEEEISGGNKSGLKGNGWGMFNN